jgi:mono/diheme cytochrome c family protein
MRTRYLLAAFAAALLVTFSYARQNPSKVVIPYEHTSPANGKQMYVNYCAPCHGRDGKGNGPAASSLRQRPTDLTLLARNNHGQFPDAHVAAILRFGSDHPAHGSAEMPVWGPMLGTMDKSNQNLRMLRVTNLCSYLKTLQQK